MNGTGRFGSQVTRARVAALGALALVLVLAGGSVHADEWQGRLTLNGWAPNVGVDAKLGGRQIIDGEIPVTDLLKHLKFMFQGQLEVQKGAFGGRIDVFDVSVSDETNAALPGGLGQATFKVKFGMTILDVAAFWNPKGDGEGITLLIGSRVLDQRPEVDASLTLTGGPTHAQSYGTSAWLFDGLVGARWDQILSRHWGYRLEADASTGGTDYTWSVAPSVRFVWGKANRFEVSAGYRHMVIDLPNKGDLETQMTLSGARLGFRFSF